LRQVTTPCLGWVRVRVRARVRGEEVGTLTRTHHVHHGLPNGRVGRAHRRASTTGRRLGDRRRRQPSFAAFTWVRVRVRAKVRVGVGKREIKQRPGSGKG